MPSNLSTPLVFGSETITPSASLSAAGVRAPEALRPAPAANTEAAKRPAYRVLVIEDDPHIARLILVNLNRAGLEGRVALEGSAGLRAFEERPPHLVLLDLMMPVMDGFQVCEKLRAQSSVPIIIMTARLEPIHQMRGFRLGADDYVLKPFDPQLLVARVIAHLRRVYRYDNGHIQRKSHNGSHSDNGAHNGTQNHETGNSPGQETKVQASDSRFDFDLAQTREERRGEQHCIDVLSHMPEGWAGCAACNYMGPLTQFPRRNSGLDTNTLTCPNCKLEGHIKFAIG